MALLETGDGRKLPQHLASELNRLRRRLVLVRELISELDTERDEHLIATSGDAITTKVTALSEIYGVGDNFAAVLTREVFTVILEIENSWQVMSALRRCRIKVAMLIRTDVSVGQAMLEPAKRWSKRHGFGCDISQRVSSLPGSIRGLVI